jgi:hypothetical protein
MTTVWQIRSTNGGGKSTVARAFLGPYPVDLSPYAAPTKRDPARTLRYPGYGDEADNLLLGSYATACGGMDKHPAGKGFEVPIAAIRYALAHLPTVRNIICEGVLASGVYGSWHEFGLELQTQGHQLAFVYLHTPAEVCLERIRERQREAGKTPALPGTPDFDRMVENVTGKWRGTMATRTKALADGHLVYDLPPGLEVRAMQEIVQGDGEVYRAQ